MADKKKRPSILADGDIVQPRSGRGRTREDASFPVPPTHAGMPPGYVSTLNEVKDHIRSERLRAVLSVNSAMILMYWEIGMIILARQEAEGWGAKVIDRMSADLREEFPDMQGLSPRNLKYMRRFAAEWPDRAIVQRSIAQLPPYCNAATFNKGEVSQLDPAPC